MCHSRTLRFFTALAVAAVFLAACSTPKDEKLDDSGNNRAEQKAETESSEATEKPGQPAGPVESITADGSAPEAKNALDSLDSFYTGTQDAASALEVLEESGVQEMDDSSKLVYAILLRTENRLDESRSVLRDILADNSDFALAWFNLALVEHAAGNAAERDSALDSALSADNTLAEAYAFLGSLALERSEMSKAEKNFRTALDYNGDSTESLIGLAWLLAKTERVEQALPLLDRAVELEPSFVYARVDRSRVNVALRHYNAAEDDLDVAIAQEPDVPWHYLDRARIRLRHFKDYEGALSDLEAVEKLDPDNFFALVYLAGLHDEERRFAEAMEYYQRVVELRPDYVWAYPPLGKLSWMAGNYEDSRKWYLKAAAEDSDEFSYLLMAALAARRSGDEREASRMLADTLRTFERGETSYEVVRFCAERSSDYYAINALNKEENEALRERLWFYMGATYETSGNKASANAVYTRLESKRGEMEFDLAWAALNGMDGIDE